MGFIVTCADGKVRHDGPFPDRGAAAMWAEYGHYCLAAKAHRIDQVDLRAATLNVGDRLTLRYKNRPTWLGEPVPDDVIPIRVESVDPNPEPNDGFHTNPQPSFDVEAVADVPSAAIEAGDIWTVFDSDIDGGQLTVEPSKEATNGATEGN